jgi:hypothetical protein
MRLSKRQRKSNNYNEEKGGSNLNESDKKKKDNKSGPTSNTERTSKERELNIDAGQS